MRKTGNIVTAGMLRRGRQDCFDVVLVFPGNGTHFAGDFDSIRRGEHRFRHIDQESAVNAQEAVSQEVFP